MQVLAGVDVEAKTRWGRLYNGSQMNGFNFRDIDSSAGLYYMDEGKAVEAERFIRAFRAVWQAVPLAERGRMIEFWAKERRRLNSLFASDPSTCATPIEVPQVQVRLERVDGQIDGFFGQPLGYYNGVMRLPSITFWAVAVDLMDDDALACLLAHELAHAYNDAAGTAKAEEEEEENQAKQVMRGWGLDDTLIDGWLENNREAAQALFSRKLAPTS